jgi:MarR family transcriptional regulator, organic hydroperoxide resistance regulator
MIILLMSNIKPGRTPARNSRRGAILLRMTRSTLQAELHQTRPFRSSGQEAAISLLRTASIVRRVLSRVVEPYGLTLAQYNALRIIRGAGDRGIATLAIRERMIEEGTPITRLLDKLEIAGLIRRDRGGADRRQVVCHIAPEGARLLSTLDPIVDQADEETVAALSPRQLADLIATLEHVRAANAARGAAKDPNNASRQPASP